MIDQSNTISGLKEQFSALSSDLWYLAPELTLVITLLLLLGFDLIFKSNKETGIFAISISGLIFTLVVISQSFGNASGGYQIFNEMILVDEWAMALKFLFVLAGLMMLIMTTRVNKIFTVFGKSSELILTSLALILGASLMSVSVNLLMLYIAVELVSISSYILTGIVNGKQKSEASLKYVLFGGAASAVMLYGMSWLYGFTGTLNVLDPVFYTALEEVSALPLTLALTMTMGGFIFKLGAFPFHIWSPDVYQAAPTPVVALFSFVPKLAALTVLFRIVGQIPRESFDWQLLLGIVAIASMTVGNFSALWQRNAKRMMAYSSIAHAGFLLVGLLAYSASGNVAALFYGSVFLIMNFGAFLIINLLEKRTGSAEMSRYKGLGSKLPWLGVFTVIVMMALTGLPPTAGFSAKLLIFSSLWETWQSEGHKILLWVFVFGILNTAVALFYYLKIPYLLFFKQPETEVELKKW